jgi:Tol biopolymer transport system component
MTLGDGDELFPNLFPDGKQFLYASSARGHWDIYLQRTGGSAAINLTPDSPADDSEPALSHDGRSIAFRSEREGGGLFVMEATGEHPRRIAADGHLPQWSPDGKLIAYCDSTFVMPQDRGATVSRLHVLDVATGKERQLITGDAVQPNWSPNGVRIAYWGVYSGGKRQIFTVRAHGNSSTPIPVTTGASVDVNPVWSPSGRELYFISDRGGTMNIWRVAIDEESGQVTGDPQPVTMPAPYIQSMSWSQDGSKILYSQGRSQIGLYSVDFDPVGLRVTGPPVLARAGGNQNVGNFRLSPDGGRIVYDTVGDPNEDLWIANIDGSGRRKLTSDVYRDRLPSWSPSGNQILFISNRGGNGYQEYLIRPDGSGLRAITMSGKPVNAGVWLDDGKTIVASLFQHGLARLDLQGTLPARELQHLPDTPSSKGSYAFVSPAENGLLIGHINGTGENPVVMYSLAEGKLTRLGVKGVRPAWIPGTKNRYFLFLREDACYLYDRRSGEERRLFQTPHDQLYFLQLAPGARQIYVTRATRDLQIWMADFPK